MAFFTAFGAIGAVTEVTGTAADAVCGAVVIAAVGATMAGLLLLEQPLVPNVRVVTSAAATSEPVIANIFAVPCCFFGGLLVAGIFPPVPPCEPGLGAGLLPEFPCRLSCVKCAISISCTGFTSRRQYEHRHDHSREIEFTGVSRKRIEADRGCTDTLWSGRHESPERISPRAPQIFSAQSAIKGFLLFLQKSFKTPRSQRTSAKGRKDSRIVETELCASLELSAETGELLFEVSDLLAEFCDIVFQTLNSFSILGAAR